jgi:hypothetical protein
MPHKGEAFRQAVPDIPGETLPPRPGSVMPAPLPPEAEVFAGYPTLVSRSFVFDEGGTL